jgi:uncharacterized protein DUF4412
METSTNRVRALIGGILLCAPLWGATSQAAGAQGLTYEMKMTLHQAGSTSAADAAPVMAGRGQFSGGNSRMDMDASLMPLGIMGKGTYVIVKSGSPIEWIVDPAKQQYFEINVDSMARFASNAQGALGGIVKTKTSDVTADLKALGPGETIQGYATMKYRLTYSATSTVSVLGRTQTSSNTTTSDIWVAPQLAGLFNPAPRPGSQMGGNSEAAQKFAAAYAKIGKGVPIRTVSQTQAAGDHAPSMTMTMELLNIKRSQVDPSVFEIPAGYTKIDMTPVMSALAGKAGNGGLLGEMGDSAKQGAREGATQEAKSQAKDKAKGMLRGIFGRP